MRRKATLAALIFSAAACDGATPSPGGRIALGVTSGNGQTTNAARDSLDSPVRARLVRETGGGIAIRIVPSLHAQAVQGIPGEQVCAVGIGEVKLEPWNPCAITDSNGTVPFLFNPPTKAGTAMAEIRALVDGQPVVPDTVVAVVLPGPLARTALGAGARLIVPPSPDGRVHFGADLFTDTHDNAIPFRVTAEAPLSVTGATHGTVDAMAVSLGGAAVGDTATLAFLRSAGDTLAVARATVTKTAMGTGLTVDGRRVFN